MLLCAIPSWLSAISEDVPKSMAKRIPGASTRMHVWNRPPLPKASPEPTKWTFTVIFFSSFFSRGNSGSCFNDTVPTLRKPAPAALR